MGLLIEYSQRMMMYCNILVGNKEINKKVYEPQLFIELIRIKFLRRLVGKIKEQDKERNNQRTLHAGNKKVNGKEATEMVR